MDPSSAQLHRQEMNSHTLESMLVCTKPQQDQKKPRPPDKALKCPRCESTNTKFCYYNNYSLSQPRYFCKSCRRYWTKGGTLRNVPVGGGCRKNKKLSSSSSSKRSQEQPLTTNPGPLSYLTPLSLYDSNDLALAFARLQKQTTGQLGFDDHHHDLSQLGNPSNNNCDISGNTTTAGFFDAMRSRLNILEGANGFHNVYYGINDGNNMGHVENGAMSLKAGEEMGIPYEDVSASGATTVTTVKQEFSNVGRESENRVLWGFPWQLGGDGNMGADLDSGRHSWNGFGSSWHGLLNSPLL